MKQFLDTKYLKISIYTLSVVILSILASKLFSHTDNIIPKISEVVHSFLSILSPIICGFLIAYLMNPAMVFFERFLIKRTQPRSSKQFHKIRVLSICLVYLCFFGTLILTIKFLVPQIASNIKFLGTNLPFYLEEFKTWLATFEKEMLEQFSGPTTTNLINQLLNPIKLETFFNPDILTTMLDTVISSAMSVTGILLDWIIGFVISLYVLMQKETFCNGSKRFAFALFKPTFADKIILLFSETHYMITRFFVGKSLDSLIIGIMCFVGLWIMDNPYALLLSLIVGVSNMIPYFGPVIGAIPAVILTLFVDPWSAVLVALFILFLQQFDGLYLGPKILGDSIGITPFWIISAITIGGALWGPLGMFFASPLLAVILNMCNRWIDRKLISRAIDLPKLSHDDIIPSIHPPTTTISLFKKGKKKVED